LSCLTNSSGNPSSIHIVQTGLTRPDPNDCIVARCWLRPLLAPVAHFTLMRSNIPVGADGQGTPGNFANNKEKAF